MELSSPSLRLLLHTGWWGCQSVRRIAARYPAPRKRPGSRGCLLLLDEVQLAAGNDRAPLARRQVQPGPERPRRPVAVRAHEDLDLLRTVGDHLAERGDRQVIPDLEPAVRPCVDEQRAQTLRDQVAAVDAREPLGEHGPDAKVERGERRVLAAR